MRTLVPCIQSSFSFQCKKRFLPPSESPCSTQFNISPTFCRDHYVLQVSWVSDTKLGVLYQNRLQNTSYYVLCSHPGYQCDKVYSQIENINISHSLSTNISPLVTMSVMSCIKPNLLWLHNFYGHKIWREIFFCSPDCFTFKPTIAQLCTAIFCLRTIDGNYSTQQRVRIHSSTFIGCSMNNLNYFTLLFEGKLNLF